MAEPEDLHPAVKVLLANFHIFVRSWQPPEFTGASVADKSCTLVHVWLRHI